MTKMKKVLNLLLGLYLILMGLGMILLPEQGVGVAMTLMSLILVVIGIRGLILYFTMAKHMVGGKSILYLNMVLLDFGLVSASMVSQSKLFILAYLIAAHAFTGVVGLLRANEERRYGVGSWKFKYVYAIFNLAIVLACLFFFKSVDTLVRVYGIGIILSGAGEILKIARKEEVVYVM